MTAPVAALLLVVSILGIPVGLTLGALYVIALLIGILASECFIGDFEAKLLKSGPMTTRGQRALLLLAGVLTLAVLRSLPFVGGWIVFLSVLFGFGALTVWMYQAYSQTSAPSAA